MEIGIFGILLTITGTLGLILGGPMDDRFGARPVLMVSLVVLIICSLGMISVDETTVLFIVKTQAAPEGQMFASLPEQVFIGVGRRYRGGFGAFAGLLPKPSGPVGP